MIHPDDYRANSSYESNTTEVQTKMFGYMFLAIVALAIYSYHLSSQLKNVKAQLRDVISIAENGKEYVRNCFSDMKYDVISDESWNIYYQFSEDSYDDIVDDLHNIYECYNNIIDSAE